MEQILSTVSRTLEALVVSEKVETGEASITMATLAVAFAEDPALLERLDNAIFAIKLEEGNEPDEREAQAMLDEQNVQEGVDNDGLTDAEATVALDEQTTWPQDEFGREIDPSVLQNFAVFAKVNGQWRLEGFMADIAAVVDAQIIRFKKSVEAENGPDTAFAVKLPN